jgi:hypothetical protein
MQLDILKLIVAERNDFDLSLLLLLIETWKNQSNALSDLVDHFQTNLVESLSLLLH